MSGSSAPAFHPLANLFPLIEGEAFAELVADIGTRGLEDAIVLHEGMILDGRNRFRACQAAGIEPRFTIFGLAAEPTAFMVRAALEGRALTDHEMRLTPIDLGELEPDFTVTGVPGADALGYVLSKNMHRRHLDASQRALVAARLATLAPGRPAAKEGPHPDPLPQAGEGEEKELLGRTGDTNGKAANLRVFRQEEAAELLNVSERSVQTARTVLEHGAPELVHAVEQGTIAVSAAADLSALSLDEQRRAIEAADPRALGAVVKSARAEKQERKRRDREARERGLAARQRGLPEKRYGVIYADPEWRFEPYSRDSGMDRAADNHYPTSDTNDIVARPVGDIAAKDCVLFLWATAPMLPAALRVMDGWGFTYKSHLIWAKDRPGTGYWFRSEHELLLVGARGEIPAPAMGSQCASVINAPVGKHSEKAEVFAKIIEDYFPTLPKIELNARRARPGWDIWGLEAPEGEQDDEIAHADIAGRSEGEEGPAGLCGPGDDGVRSDGTRGSPGDAGEEGGDRAGGARTPLGTNAASGAGIIGLGELNEWSALRAVEDGEAIDAEIADFLISKGFARREGRALKTTMLGGLRLMNLTRYANATPDQRKAMRTKKGDRS